MGVVLEVRVFPLIGAVTPMTVNIPAVGMGKVGNGRNEPPWATAKIRSATVADGFVRLPPNDGGLGNVPRAG